MFFVTTRHNMIFDKWVIVVEKQHVTLTDVCIQLKRIRRLVEIAFYLDQLKED